MKNIFDKTIAEETINRINQLKPYSRPLWGKMNVAQMLAHCNVTYETVYEDKHKKPNTLMSFILKVFVKNVVVNEAPYKRNNPTAPHFIISDQKNFDIEKQRLIDYIVRTQQLGERHFYKMKSHSFGILSIKEWNNMFYKHLDHHLSQFGV